MAWKTAAVPVPFPPPSFLAAQAGFKFSISNSADFVLGYEYYQIQGYNDPGYHTIKLGFSWNF